MAVWRGRTAVSRSTGMLTRPNVIVPDHNERTRAPLLSSSAGGAAARLRLRLGNFLLLGGGEAGFQAVGETALDTLFLRGHRLDLVAARFGFDQLVQALPIVVLPLL